jgi:hypothetical protein
MRPDDYPECHSGMTNCGECGEYGLIIPLAKTTKHAFEKVQAGFGIYLSADEAEDLRDCISIATKSGQHKDSPKFWKAAKELDERLVGELRAHSKRQKGH